MNSNTALLALVVTVPFILFIIRLVRKRRLRAKYSFFWLVVGIVVAILAVFPGLINALADAAGVVYPPALLFLGAIVFLLFIAVHFSWELSRLEDRTRTLAEELGLANARIAEFEADSLLRTRDGDT